MRTIGLLALGVTSFFAGILFDSALSHVPREARAQIDLIKIEQAVRRYYKDQKSLPATLGDVRDGGKERMKMRNTYGNPIEYETSNGVYVVLRAYGYGGEFSRVKNVFVRSFDVREERSPETR